MNYSSTQNKTYTELEKELITVWESHYLPYTGKEYAMEIRTFQDMVSMFANDDFYNLHLVAREYLKVKFVYIED